ncbi:MAG: cation diffusion facilitator family transporter [Flavobacteriales bacterium]|jgi:cation diffusion facilitator family transporter
MTSRSELAIKTSWLSIAGNALLAVIKGVTGVLGNSYALIADAIESTTDVLASVLVLIGLKYSNRPADANHPYGHGKAEAIVTFVTVAFLFVSATVIAVEAIHHIRTPHHAPKPYTLFVLGGIIIWKELFYRIVSKRSDETHSSSLKADAWHHRSDAITSLMAFIGISIALWMGKGYEAADDYAALFASGFIIYNAYLILRPALGEIMDEHQHDELIAEIRKHAHTVEGVVDTEKCYVRKTGMNYYVDLHLTVPGDNTVRKGHEIAHAVKNTIMEEHPEIADVFIHVEPHDLC